MSLDVLKHIIENYDPATITDNEIEGLKTMLRCATFQSLKVIIENKLSVIYVYQEKELKKTEQAKGKSYGEHNDYGYADYGHGYPPYNADDNNNSDTKGKD